MEIWNDIIEQGESFPGEIPLNRESAAKMFASQSMTACACSESEDVLGFYILHPNNIGRCSHIANASYGVDKSARGCGVGKALVEDSLKRLSGLGFIAMQFNAVVSTNTVAVRLYEKLGFDRIGTVKNGFRLKSGELVDTYLFYKTANSD